MKPEIERAIESTEKMIIDRISQFGIDLIFTNICDRRKKRGRESFIDMRWQQDDKCICRVVRASLPVALPIMS